MHRLVLLSIQYYVTAIYVIMLNSFFGMSTLPRKDKTTAIIAYNNSEGLTVQPAELPASVMNTMISGVGRISGRPED